MLSKLNLSKDIQKYCSSFLTDYELIYIEGDWHKFSKYNVCALAAKNGWLDLLMFARKNGCDWNELVCSHAAENGYLEILKWAKENGCKWDRWTCSYAAENGHLTILKWAKNSLAPSEMGVNGICGHVHMPL